MKTWWRAPVAESGRIQNFGQRFRMALFTTPFLPMPKEGIKANYKKLQKNAAVILQVL